MADSGTIFSIALVIITFFLYGFKWSVLIAITIFLCALFLSFSNSRGSRNAVKNKPKESDEYFDRSDMDSYIESPTTRNMESREYGTRLVKNIVRRNPSLTQNVPCNDLLMYKRRQDRHISSLISPQPLLSQVTRHLSFNNISYYHPDRTKLNLTTNKSIYCTPPKWYNPSDTTQVPLPDKTSSFIEERYSPRQFRVVSPSSNTSHNVSTVKISSPGDNDSRFALESILQKRLERTKDSPGSRQSVLSALGQRSRKRPAYDSDSSMVEGYSVKKRRRDDLDDFLDAVNNPLSSPYTGIKSIKRPYSDFGKPTLEITTKRSKDETGPDSKLSPPLRNFAGSAFEDSGVDVNSPTKILQESQAKVVQPTKLRKRKSVTFSDQLVNSSPEEDKVTPERNKLTPEHGEILNAKKDSEEDCSQIFRIGFSPRKSLAPEYLSSNRTESKKSPRCRSNITWKDLQENRREAWRRSQKLLDDIEESFSKEMRSTSVVTTISTTTVTSPVTSLPAPTVPFTSLQNTIAQVQTSTVANPLTNFINSTATEQPRQMRPTSVIGSNTLFTGVSSRSLGDSTFPGPKNSSSFTVLFGGTSSVAAVSSSAPSVSSTNTSSKANTTSQQSLSFQASITSTSTVSQPSTLSTFTFQPSGVSTGNVTQTTTPVIQSTTAGLFTAGVGSTPRSNIQTSNVSTISTVTQPKVGGFSFSSTAVTKTTTPNNFSFNAPAVTTSNFSGGFNTQAVEKTTAQKSFTFATSTTIASTAEKLGTSGGFTFTAPTAEKPGTSGGFTFTAPTAEKPATGGFTFTAPSAEKSGTSGGFTFTAPSAEKSGTSGGFTFSGTSSSGQTPSNGFAFAAPTTDKASGSGGFQFNAPSVNNNISTFSFTASATKNANASGGFSFNTGTGNKPSNNTGFNFEGQNTTGTFNFGSPAPAGGFNFSGGFAASTPIPTNSGRGNNTLARTRQRRRAKR